MNDLISPRYVMKLVKSVEKAIWDEYETFEEIDFYINKWHESDNYSNWENFSIFLNDNDTINLPRTLHGMDGSLLLKIAIDLGVETPDFIPSIPTFRNEIKSDYKTAYDTFNKAFKQIETDPSLAIGLANSALESITKEILTDDAIKSRISGKGTLYQLTTAILKAFNFLDHQHPSEIKTINKAIEDIRSDKTHFHGKTADDFLIKDPLYAYFVINTVATVGLFIISYYKGKYPKANANVNETDELPF
jgi:hypothetical protein